MGAITDYFPVVLNKDPYDKPKEIGRYSKKDLAEEVAEFVVRAFLYQIKHTDIQICWNRDWLIRTNAGLRLKKITNDKIIWIEESFNSDMVEDILRRIPLLLGPDEIELSVIVPKRRIYQPIHLWKGQFHCVVLTFSPFDDSHKLYAGCYKTKEVALEAVAFIIRLHGRNKVDTQILSQSTTYVEYNSGKSYVKIDGSDMEIKFFCNDKEYLRLINVINEFAIKTEVL